MNRCFELPEDFNVYHMQETLEALKLWLHQGKVADGALIDISAARVAEIDGTGMQLLAALQNSGYRMRIVEASRKFTEACDITGNSAWLAAGVTA